MQLDKLFNRFVPSFVSVSFSFQGSSLANRVGRVGFNQLILGFSAVGLFPLDLFFMAPTLPTSQQHFGILDIKIREVSTDAGLSDMPRLARFSSANVFRKRFGTT